MAKSNAMLARIEARAEAKYKAMFHQRMDTLQQMHMDAAMIAAHSVLQLGPGRAAMYCEAYIEAVNEMARLVVEDAKDDKEIWFAKEKIDEQIRAIVGADKFSPWDERYKIREEEK